MKLCEHCSADIRYCGHTLASQIGKVMHEISHGCDGPVTCFVLISRATELAASGRFSAEAVANGLSEALSEFGYLSKAGEHSNLPGEPVYNTAD
jgi:hypothetical protein